MGKKEFIIIFLLCIIFLPVTSAALTTADAIGSIGASLMVFLFGLALGIFGIVIMYNQDNWIRYIGITLLIFGLVLLYSTINMSLVISNELSFTGGLASQYDDVYNIISIMIRVVSALAMILMIVFVIRLLTNAVQDKKISDDFT